MDDDWDLHAVVRGCSAATTPASSAVSTTSSAAYTAGSPFTGQIFTNFQQDCNFSAEFRSQDLFEPRTERFFENLHDIYKPFFPTVQNPSLKVPISPLSVLGGLQDLSSEQQQQQKQQIVIQESPHHQKQLLLQKQKPTFTVVNGSNKAGVSNVNNPSSRSKKRKNHLKKVCHVAAENLSSDMWSWRKYGQKPIKGSPYPRGYYKCSTLKGCMARKQVERNRSDPGMFIVTYTSEHNHPMPTHRSSLAGSTRHKSDETPNPKKAASCSPECSPAATHSPEMSPAETHSPPPEDDGLSVSDMAVDDDFFAGLEGFVGPDGGESMLDHFQFPWVVEGGAAASAAACGGGGGGGG